MSIYTILTITFLTILGLVLIRILFKPLKVFFKVIYSCLIGMFGILLFNAFGGLLGLHIGLNLITVITIGFLGLPGVALLLILQYIFRV